jgi:glycosyltransferase involved in cell wall biosynthesis
MLKCKHETNHASKLRLWNKAMAAGIVKPPTVTAIIPNYNNAVVIRRAIDSVLAQSFSDFELLVVDDASTDESLAVIRTYDDPRLRLLVNVENVGVAGVWNRAVQEAQGEWVALLDSDDSWQPEKLSRQMAFLREHPDLAGCTCGYRHVCLDGTQIVIPTERDTRIRQVLFQNILHTGTTMVARREVFAEIGWFDETLRRGQDTDFLLRLLSRKRLAVVPAVLASVYQHTQRSADTLAQSRALMLDKHREAYYQQGWLFARRKIAHMWADVAYQYARDGNRVGMRRYALRSIAAFPFQPPGIYLILLDGITGWRLQQSVATMKRRLNDKKRRRRAG